MVASGSINGSAPYHQIADAPARSGAVVSNVTPERLAQIIAEQPLLAQLPDELKAYLRFPTGETAHTMKREGAGACCHTVLAHILFPYSICKTFMVREGQIALTWNDQKPEILGPGRHSLLKPTNTLSRIVNVNEPTIQHGPLHIIRVAMGQLGYGLDSETGLPVLLTTGKHFIDSATFAFRQFLDLTRPVNELGALKLVRVETGNVGYMFQHGNLIILTPGIHLVSPPDRFGGILSTQQQTLELPVTVAESGDYVPLRLKADVFFRIRDAKKALTEIQDITKQVRELAVATIAGIIRSSTLADIAGSSKVSAGDDNEERAPFFQHVHDTFMTQLHDHVLEHWGIEISNIRIESLSIDDQNLSRNISKQAVTISQQEAEYRMLQKQTDIINVKASNRAQELKIAADAEAQALRISTEAEAQSTIIRARAQRDAKILEGEGEAEYARKVNETAIGAKLAELRIQVEALQGINSIAYVPHLPALMQKNNAIFNMDAMPTAPNHQQ